MPGLVERVKAFCTLHRLFMPGTVVVAVSGGADSVALLHVLIQLQETLRITLHAATFDHSLRGDEGAADVAFVRDLAEAWGVPVTAGAADVQLLAEAEKMGIEAAARRARYGFLAHVAGEQGAKCIATGHQRDDQAETVLMHVLRGTGLAGLRGMLPLTPWSPIDPQGRTRDLALARPLLDVSRAEIDEYVRGLGVTPRQDATNTDPAYTRNRIRREILPALAQINPDVRDALARLGELARDDYVALLETLPEPTPREGGLSFRLDALHGLSAAQIRAAIRRAAQETGPEAEVSFERTEAARAFLMARRRGVIELGGGLRFEMSSEHALIYHAAHFPPGAPWLAAGTILDVDGPGTYSLPGSGWRLNVATSEGDPPQDAYVALLALPREARLALRTPRPGDRLRPHGMSGRSRKLSDMLIDMQVRAAWRDRLPVLEIDGEVAWFVAPVAEGVRGRIAEPFAGPREGAACMLFRFEPPEKEGEMGG